MLGVVGVAVVGVGYLLLRPSTREGDPPTWGERLGRAVGDVGDAIGSLDRLFS